MSNEYETNAQPIDPVRKDESYTGQYITIKPPAWKRLLKIFFPTDVTDVKDFLIWDVLIPNAKLFLLKSINDAMGSASRIPSYEVRSTTSSRFWANNVSYAQHGDTLPESFTSSRGASTSSLKDLEGLGYQTEEKARKARNELYFKAKHNNVATVYDFCQVSEFWNPVNCQTVPVEPKWNYQDFGWTLGEIEKANIVYNGSIYLIDLPTAKDIRSLKR
jgi:hypothetical protein